MNDPLQISSQTLDLAVSRGMITPAIRGDLVALELRQRGALPPQDEEQFRFISGFGDIFVTIGLGLFLGAAGYFTSEIGAGTMAVTIAALSWLLAEYFTARRRMALPSIVLLISFVFAIFAALTILLTQIFTPYETPLVLDQALTDRSYAFILVASTLGTALAAGLHYWRFHVPITVGAGALALAGSALGLLAALAPDFALNYLNLMFLIAGIAIFALAMYFDTSDPRRITIRTDIAFWLHLAAAPLIVHPLVLLLVSNYGGYSDFPAWQMLGLFLFLAIIAILVDRRAILVSSLSYTGVAFGTLVGTSGLSGSAFPLTLLVLGCVILLLSVFWQKMRALFLALLPPAIAGKLPGPHLQARSN